MCVCVKQGCRIFLFDQKRNMRPLENCMADFCAMADLSTLLGTRRNVQNLAHEEEKQMSSYKTGFSKRRSCVYNVDC